MRRIFLMLAICTICRAVNAQCPTLDYSKYVEVFRDDFDYSVSTFKSDPTFLSKWEMMPLYPCDGWGYERYGSSQVTMPSSGIIRLTAIDNIYTPCDSFRPKADKPARHLSGMLATKKPNYISIGIIEARIKIPPHQSADSLSAWPAFWMIWGKDWVGDHQQYTEIDILDNSDGRTYSMQTNVFFKDGWKTPYIGASGWPSTREQYTVRTNKLDDMCFPLNAISDLSDAFHTYSCLWTPSRVSFYLDGYYVNHFDFNRDNDKARTFPDFQNLLLTLQTNKHTVDSLTMDIDMVRFLALKCDESDFVLDHANTHPSLMTTPLVLPPDFNKQPQFNMLKHKSILINYPSVPPVKPNEKQATILEAQSITILPDFVADQSAPVWGPVTMRDTIASIDVPLNGYFEIRPILCGQNSQSWFKTGEDNNKASHFPDSDIVEDLHGLIISPNPNDGYFTIELPDENSYEIRVTNIFGEKVSHKEIRLPRKIDIMLDKNGLASGNYIIHVKGANINHVQKILITK